MRGKGKERRHLEEGVNMEGGGVAEFRKFTSHVGDERGGVAR